MNNKERYDRIVNEIFELNGMPINESMTRGNTEKWNSLLHLTFVTAIEDEFEIMLDTQDILNLTSYSAGLEIIDKYC
ncbi:MAG: acyl carrier protein [Dorea sp.]|nr:acyl carrier protein [Dorea sp.]